MLISKERTEQQKRTLKFRHYFKNYKINGKKMKKKHTFIY